MKYYSTNGKAPVADLRKAVVKGLAEDRGLYMPEVIHQLPKQFFTDMPNMSFQDIAFNVASAFFGDDVDLDSLQDLVYDTLQFPCPVVKVKDRSAEGRLQGKNIYSLELFHGPTLAFKDVGARFMARLLQYFLRHGSSSFPVSCNSVAANKEVNVLVATSGDTGSAVANGFLGVEGIHVYVLYPKGKVSPIQECQFTTLGKNITAIEVDGVFDDCQALVKSAFMDQELNEHMMLTSANSINVARFLPQAFYYFNAVAQLSALGHQPSDIVICVPSGNFGNICAALFGHQMGMPVKRFIAANNANDIFYNYLQTGQYNPKPSKQTLANAMDVGDPSNFARIINLYSQNGKLSPEETHQRITSLISGATYSDEQIRETMRQCYKETGYILDPHGACGYRALEEQLKPGEIGVFCETAHPAKFKEKVDEILGIDVEIPERLAAFMKGQKQSVPMTKNFDDFKKYLLAQ
ncbi:threonine synthase [Prevotella sp. E15-22]|uniref:threonine synthase n=1 Tax=Prevotella sp. E15-22 TaxID=2937774 RepID=UPI00206595D3|nr:threonine synthase [Prevotella sp. E15-22]UPS45390.1 threonine synthase [Prevotella sp. E15-22]